MNNIKYTFANTQNDLNKMVDLAIKSASTAKNKIQIAAVAILHHAFEHGDYTGANRLVVGLNDSGVRRNSLVKYFEIYGGLVLNDDKETVKEQPFKGWAGSEHIRDNFEGAKVTMWNKVIEEKETFVDMDLQADLSKLLTRYGKQIELANKAGDKFRGKITTRVLGETFEQLNALVNIPDRIEVKDEDIMRALEGQINAA